LDGSEAERRLAEHGRNEVAQTRSTPAVAALYVPPLQSILETEPLGWSGAALATAALMSGYLAAGLTRSAF
jgi:hypothetical protein